MSRVKVLVATHGGLGNQLFQVFAALLLAERYNCPVKLNHYDYYAHKFTLEVPITDLGITAVSGAEKSLLDARMGKIAEKLRGRSMPLHFFGSVIIDGYFQDWAFYKDFDPVVKRQVLSRIARALQIRTNESKQYCLVHIRLGDFFSNEEDKREQLISSLENAEPGSHIITNEESLLDTAAAQTVMTRSNLRVLRSVDLSAIDVLRLMSCYNKIISNGSTLALWAALLGGGRVQIGNTALELFVDNLSERPS